MDNIIIINAEGTYLEEAFNNQANFNIAIDATAAWNKADTTDINEFALEFLRKKTALTEGLGAFIVLQKYKVVIPSKEVKAENIVGVGTRKWKTVYKFIDPRTEAVIIPTFEIAGTKGAAVKQAKELAVEMQTDILIGIDKVMVQGNTTVSIIKKQQPQITPGKYIFFGIEDAPEEIEA